MFRKTAFASLIALGNAVATASGAAQAADGGPQLVNRNGSQEVVYDQDRRANIVGGAFAAITGGGENTDVPGRAGRRPLRGATAHRQAFRRRRGRDVDLHAARAGRRARLNTGSRGAALSAPRDATRATGTAIR